MVNFTINSSSDIFKTIKRVRKNPLKCPLEIIDFAVEQLSWVMELQKVASQKIISNEK